MTDWRNAAPKGNDEYATKPELWRPIADAMGGFDLDPAAGCEPEQIASERFTEADDGLSKKWYGTVWLNPPFSEKAVWYRRLVDQYTNGDVDRAVAISPVDPACEWYQRWIETADVFCFVDGRDCYIRNPGSGGSPSFSTGVSVWNPTDALIDVLQSKGVVSRVVHDTDQTTLGETHG